MAADTAAWRQVMNDGLRNMIENLKAMLKPSADG